MQTGLVEQSQTAITKIGVIHPGEMGVAVAATARNSGLEVCWASEGRSPATRRRAADAGLADAGSIPNLCETCPAIVSVCPPESAEAVAEEVLRQGFRGLFIDANAISPERARRIAHNMSEDGADFVDASIIGLPATTRSQTWLYFSGKRANAAAACFSGGPLETEILGQDPGEASALKMCFAAHTKGIAGLRAAVLGAAETLGVREALERQWSRSGDLGRVVASVQHVSPKAWRFVAEMHEIASTFEAAGMPPGFHLAAAEVFARLAEFKGASDIQLADVLSRLTRETSRV